jgi:hypothetical protein
MTFSTSDASLQRRDTQQLPASSPSIVYDVITRSRAMLQELAKRRHPDRKRQIFFRPKTNVNGLGLRLGSGGAAGYCASMRCSFFVILGGILASLTAGGDSHLVTGTCVEVCFGFRQLSMKR